MSRRIYKYPFKVNDHVELTMPRGATILHVACQAGVPYVWALVDIDEPMEVQEFRVFGTGHPLPDEPWIQGLHVATFMQGALVWHLFMAKV